MLSIKLLLFLFAVIAASNGGVVPDDEVARLDAERNNYHIFYSFGGELFDTNATNLPVTADEDTVIVIHGQGGHYRDIFSTMVQQGFRAGSPTANVIVMDWSFLAGQSYSNAARDLPFAANELAKLINILKDNVVTTGGFHLVGFGLGAHLAGNAGYQLRTTRPVNRITGLDPTGRNFGSNNRRLSQHDANYVEVIHTDGGALGSGIGTDIGHVDFFVNGGNNQPGCLSSSCSHDRAYEVFAATLEFNHLIGYRCTTNTQINLNTCRGNPLRMGGPEMSKIPLVPGSYRANTGRYFPF